LFCGVYTLDVWDSILDAYFPFAVGLTKYMQDWGLQAVSIGTQEFKS
jgi:hypothetical protein